MPARPDRGLTLLAGRSTGTGGSGLLGPDCDEPAVRELYDTHAADLLRFVTRMLDGDRYRAEDTVQETLLRAWRHPESRTADGGWSRPWLFTVAKRIAIDHVRAVRARPTEVADERIEERPQSDDQIDALLNRREVRAALETLPARLRCVIIEVYFRERSVAEAAQVLGIPEGTVKSRSYYALRALRDALAERGFTPPGPVPAPRTPARANPAAPTVKKP